MVKNRSESNPICQRTNLQQSLHFIYQIESTHMGYLELKGF